MKDGLIVPILGGPGDGRQVVMSPDAVIVDLRFEPMTGGPERRCRYYRRVVPLWTWTPAGYHRLSRITLQYAGESPS